MEQEQVKLHERVSRVETNLETIMTNHLPHLQKEMESVNTKMWAIILLLISTLVGIITSSI